MCTAGPHAAALPSAQAAASHAHVVPRCTPSPAGVTRCSGCRSCVDGTSSPAHSHARRPVSPRRPRWGHAAQLSQAPPRGPHGPRVTTAIGRGATSRRAPRTPRGRYALAGRAHRVAPGTAVLRSRRHMAHHLASLWHKVYNCSVHHQRRGLVGALLCQTKREHSTGRGRGTEPGGCRNQAQTGGGRQRQPRLVKGMSTCREAQTRSPETIRSCSGSHSCSNRCCRRREGGGAMPQGGRPTAQRPPAHHRRLPR